MNETYIKNVIEAALLAAGRSLQLTELTQLFDESARPDEGGMRAALAALEADYGSRGIELKETSSGFRIQVRKDLANEVSRLWPERPPRYSRALLETLALIAYRQPITRAEIENVRGVAVNPNIIKTVIERNWVKVVGTRDVPGRPELLGTTQDFLDYFGLRSLDELPPLAELKAMGDVNLQLDLAKPGDGAAGAPAGADGAAAAANADAAESSAAAAAVAAVAAADAGADASAGDADAAQGEALAASEASSEVSSEATAVDSTATVDNTATADDSVAETFEIEPDAASQAVAHMEIESDSGDVTVEVETLSLVEARIEASIETDDVEASESPQPDDSGQQADDAVATQAADALATQDETVVAQAESDSPADDTVAGQAVSESPDDAVAGQAFSESPDDPLAAQADSDSPADDAPSDAIAASGSNAAATREEPDTTLETGEFEMSELGVDVDVDEPEAADVIEAEFEADDLTSAPADSAAADSAAADSDDAEEADDEEELSASSSTATKFVAAPRDNDD